MDNNQVAGLATASGVTFLGLHMPVVVAGMLACCVIGGAGYASYKIGKAAMKKFSDSKESEKTGQPSAVQSTLA